QEYQELAEKLNIKNIKLMPKVSQQQLAIYQQACDILLMPFPWTEHYAYFMSPLKMFENMASGRPIIATDLPAIKEVLNQNNAFLVKPDDPQDLARGIGRLIQDQQLSITLANQSLKDIQQYTWQARVEKIIKFILTEGGIEKNYQENI
ncbi:glycosyl transferase family 1, partial [Candidatus Kuenenbacteria bacterium CG_4_8_14_3_um_filter_39_15]